MVVLTNCAEVGAAAARIRRLYGDCLAEPERYARGRTWYGTARAILVGAAEEYGSALEQAVSVLAITSPACQLSTNVRWTVEALRTRGRAKVGRYPSRMVPAVRAALRDPDGCADWARGPKVGAFYRAILGDDQAVVLDRWALYAALGERDATLVGASEKRAAESAYRRVAAEVGETPRELQAVVWTQVRETTPHARTGRPHKLTDVHDLVGV